MPFLLVPLDEEQGTNDFLPCRPNTWESDSTKRLLIAALSAGWMVFLDLVTSRGLWSSCLLGMEWLEVTADDAKTSIFWSRVSFGIVSDNIMQKGNE